MSKRVRILLYAPGDSEPAANVWADLSEAEGRHTVTLLYDYGADLAPAAGWEIDAGRAGRFDVRTVEGRVLDCNAIS